MSTNLISNDQIISSIYELIDEASEYLLLVAPYVNLWGHLRNHLEKSTASTKIVILRNENLEEKSNVIAELNEIGIRVKALVNLHAKIYLSEKSCIISSMNLYDYSAANNEEIGIKITDKDSIQEIRNYVKDLSKRSKEVKSGELPASRKSSNLDKIFIQKSRKATKKGFCIRCKRKIKLDPDKPLCLECYDEWSFYENPAYKENYCHVCGRVQTTSIAKPLCKQCFGKSY